MSRTQSSIQQTEAQKAQVEALRGWGYGSLTSIVRIATDRMFREEWLRRNRGQETRCQERPRD